MSFHNKNLSKFSANDELHINLSGIVHNLPGHVYWHDKEGIILGCNDKQAKSFGFSCSDQVIGKCIYSFHPAEITKILKENNFRVIEYGEELSVEEPVQFIDGTIHTFFSKKVPLLDNDKNIIGLLGISVDITEEKENEKKYHLVLEKIISAIPSHIYWKDRNLKFLGCNDAQARTIGLKWNKEIIGKSAYDVITSEQLDTDRRKQAELIDKVDREVLLTGKSKILEEPLRLKDGSIRDFLSQKVPLYNDSGDIIGIIGISIDITDQKKIEAELKNATAQIQGMTLVSAAMAHELRTPLAGIIAGAKGLEKYFKIFIDTYELAKKNNICIEKISSNDMSLLSSVLESIKSQAKQANMVINMLLTNLSHGKNPVPRGVTQRLSMKECINNSLNQYVFGPGQRELVHTELEKDFIFLGEPNLFTHVILNLLKNSLYFIDKASKGEIYIWLEIGQEYNKLHFKDTAQGIKNKYLNQVFDQFFTKDTHHGTGIGLAFCKAVIDSWGGEVFCNSIYGEFIEFTFKFKKQKIIQD